MLDQIGLVVSKPMALAPPEEGAVPIARGAIVRCRGFSRSMINWSMISRILACHPECRELITG
jgi:hypothetical protein